mmetsp:Transcript_6255/g.9618  ORF Transcript_6255/g.9618 Transcript_6255/m.9618 type:complete len:486 (+) Transcript_6255:132-1589(+)
MKKKKKNETMATIAAMIVIASCCWSMILHQRLMLSNDSIPDDETILQREHYSMISTTTNIDISSNTTTRIVLQNNHKDRTNKVASNHDDHQQNSDNHCLKVVTHSGGWGNRLGPIMCALGLASSGNHSLHVLWNAANEGTQGPAPRTAHTGRGGYSFHDIRRLTQVPFEWVVAVENSTSTSTSSHNHNQNETLSQYSFYADSMATDVGAWKNFIKRRGHFEWVQDYQRQEDAFEALPCDTIPIGHRLEEDNIGKLINDYTPEPCWTRYQLHAQTEQFSYLQPSIEKKEDFVNRLIARTRLIRPTLDLCLPQPAHSYIVLHARRGDRAAQAVATNLWSDLSDLAPIVPVVLISENATVLQEYTQEAQAYNFTLLTKLCTPRQLLKRYDLQHRPTVAMLQDYFLMAQSSGVITDYSWDQSSFSTTAALGNGLPMLYPAASGKQHSLTRFFARDGNNGKVLRNVYYLNTLSQYIQRVQEEMKRGEGSS